MLNPTAIVKFSILLLLLNIMLNHAALVKYSILLLLINNMWNPAAIDLVLLKILNLTALKLHFESN